ncbi:MAG: nucleoside phosphorylase [Anaerolineae bacterium]|nr:nucleoside phosphorylase [Anaerolineae bacterium]
MRRDYPILEFDPTLEAVIEPAQVIAPVDAPERCVVCFFQDVISKLRQDKALTTIFEEQWEDCIHPFYEFKMDGQRLALFHPGVGGPVAAGMLETAIALGCRKFIACGGAGVLDHGIAVGHVVVPRVAIRDEGTSYHYLPPSREVEASPEGVAAIEQVLDENGVEYLTSKTWTTDAPYRETPTKVRLRRSEGCLTVEMEAATFFAVARFRGVVFAQMLYGGDDVSSEAWDHRDWVSRTSVRERLFWLAAEACSAL